MIVKLASGVILESTNSFVTDQWTAEGLVEYKVEKVTEEVTEEKAPKKRTTKK